MKYNASTGSFWCHRGKCSRGYHHGHEYKTKRSETKFKGQGNPSRVERGKIVIDASAEQQKAKQSKNNGAAKATALFAPGRRQPN